MHPHGRGVPLFHGPLSVNAQPGARVWPPHAPYFVPPPPQRYQQQAGAPHPLQDLVAQATQRITESAMRVKEVLQRVSTTYLEVSDANKSYSGGEALRSRLPPSVLPTVMEVGVAVQQCRLMMEMVDEWAQQVGGSDDGPSGHRSETMHRIQECASSLHNVMASELYARNLLKKSLKHHRQKKWRVRRRRRQRAARVDRKEREKREAALVKQMHEREVNAERLKFESEHQRHAERAQMGNHAKRRMEVLLAKLIELRALRRGMPLSGASIRGWLNRPSLQYVKDSIERVAGSDKQSSCAPVDDQLPSTSSSGGIVEHHLQRVLSYHALGTSSLEGLIHVREAWDRYLVPPGKGEGIPRGWVRPSPPSSEQWRRALVRSRDQGE